MTAKVTFGSCWQPAASIASALLVRASRSAKQRVLRPDGEGQDLWDFETTLPPLAITDLTIPAAGGLRARKERMARLERRTAPVAVLPPQSVSGQNPLSLFAVSATEIAVAETDEPLHWLLLTTERPAPELKIGDLLPRPIYKNVSRLMQSQPVALPISPNAQGNILTFRQPQCIPVKILNSDTLC